MTQKRLAIAVVIRLLPGPEPWVRIEYGERWFKLPLFAPIEELVHGVVDKWSSVTPGQTKMAEPTVRIPLAQWQALESAAATARGLHAPPGAALLP